MSHLLLRAARDGDIEKLKSCLDAGDDIEFQHRETGRTALLFAVIGGHLDAVRLLLEKGADITASCKTAGDDSLLWAIEQGYEDVVELLLERGAAPNAIPESSFIGRTPLMVAAQHGNIAIARQLLVAGANPGVLDRQGKSALALAEKAGHGEMAAFLREIPGANPPLPPEPQPIPWPEISWDRITPIPDGATPTQIVRGYILAMYHWEMFAHQQMKAMEEKNDFRFNFPASLAVARSIRDRYCTAKKRAYSRSSIGFPPEFGECLTLLSETYPDPDKCNVLTRFPEDIPPWNSDKEYLFTVLRKNGRWRIDAIGWRSVGMDEWGQVVL